VTGRSEADTARRPTISPVGYRGFVALAAADARPEPLHIEAATFASEAEARQWVEQGRAVARDPNNFACSVVPVYGAAID
jgi:hypothetical protein